MTADAQFDWRQARHPLVRELGWCLFSEAVVDTLPGIADKPWSGTEDRGAREILAALDRDPRPLQQHMAALGDKRLGARFEAAWSYYLANHPRYELLAHNWPVNHEGRTLGALDFLFRDHHLATVVHAEVAVKFYLYKEDRPGPALARWIGPNPDDNLQLKLQHLADHQLPLSRRDETRERLQRAGLPMPETRVVVVKGYLFHPLDQLIATVPPLNPHHLRGEWLCQRDLPGLLASQINSRWAIAPRQQWLMPERGNSDKVTLQRRVTAQLADTLQPLMLCRFGADNTEARRYFIVPDGWPG